MGISCTHYLMLGCKYPYENLDDETRSNLENPEEDQLGVIIDDMGGTYLYVGVPSHIVDDGDGFYDIDLDAIGVDSGIADDIIGLSESLGFERQEPKLWLFTH